MMQLKARNSQSNKTKKIQLIEGSRNHVLESIRETNQSTETENEKVCSSFKVQSSNNTHDSSTNEDQICKSSSAKSELNQGDC